MPLGLGRSILSRYEAPAAGGGAAYYWTDEEDGSLATGGISSNKAAYVLGKGSSPFSASYDCSTVFWFRCPNIQSRGNVWSGTMETSATNVRYTGAFVDQSRIILHTLHGSNSMNALFVGPLSGSVRTDVFDGEWHCVMMYKDASETTPNDSTWCVWDGGAYTETIAESKYGSNGTDDYSWTNYRVYNTDPRELSEIDELNFGFRDLTAKTNTSYDTANFSNAIGVDMDIGPIWIYDKYIDFSQQSVRDYYWDSTAPDGFVDGGTDGTAGGAEQPAIYMYHDGTDWKNGGTKFNSTATKITAGTGDITATDTDGPGTGATG